MLVPIWKTQQKTRFRGCEYSIWPDLTDLSRDFTIIWQMFTRDQAIMLSDRAMMLYIMHHYWR